MLWWQAWNEFCCEKETKEVDREEAWSGIRSFEWVKLSNWRTILAKVLNSLECICDIIKSTEENRIGVVKTRTDESMSNEWCSVIVKTVSDVSESLQVMVTRLGDYRLTCLWKVRDLSRMTSKLYQIEVHLIMQYWCVKYWIEYCYSVTLTSAEKNSFKFIGV